MMEWDVIVDGEDASEAFAKLNQLGIDFYNRTDLVGGLFVARNINTFERTYDGTSSDSLVLHNLGRLVSCVFIQPDGTELDISFKNVDANTLEVGSTVPLLGILIIR